MMRLAVVSDIHGNLTAFEAVLADLQETAPDVILHGGDLVTSGPRPVEIVDRIRALGWQGVVGNTDEMLWAPDSLATFLKQAPIFSRSSPFSTKWFPRSVICWEKSGSTGCAGFRARRFAAP
jgi:predicted phosphodiesterase